MRGGFEYAYSEGVWRNEVLKSLDRLSLPTSGTTVPAMSPAELRAIHSSIQEVTVVVRQLPDLLSAIGQELAGIHAEVSLIREMVATSLRLQAAAMDHERLQARLEEFIFQFAKAVQLATVDPSPLPEGTQYLLLRGFLGQIERIGIRTALVRGLENKKVLDTGISSATSRIAALEELPSLRSVVEAENAKEQDARDRADAQARAERAQRDWLREVSKCVSVFDRSEAALKAWPARCALTMDGWKDALSSEERAVFGTPLAPLRRPVLAMTSYWRARKRQQVRHERQRRQLLYEVFLARENLVVAEAMYRLLERSRLLAKVRHETSTELVLLEQQANYWRELKDLRRAVDVQEKALGELKLRPYMSKHIFPPHLIEDQTKALELAAMDDSPMEGSTTTTDSSFVRQLKAKYERTIEQLQQHIAQGPPIVVPFDQVLASCRSIR